MNATLCKYYDKYGHGEVNCRKKKGQHNVAHDKNGKATNGENVTQQLPLEKTGNVTNVNEGNVINAKKQGTKENTWITPQKNGRKQSKQQQQQVGNHQQQKVVSPTESTNSAASSVGNMNNSDKQPTKESDVNVGSQKVPDQENG